MFKHDMLNIPYDLNSDKYKGPAKTPSIDHI